MPSSRLFGRGQFLSSQLAAEGGDLDGLGAEPDVREPEAPADDPAVPEQPLDLVRMRGRADVEVLRPAAEQQVADAAADEVGDVVVLVEPVENLQRVRVDLFAGDRVLGARHDHRNPSERIVTKRLRTLRCRMRVLMLAMAALLAAHAVQAAEPASLTRARTLYNAADYDGAIAAAALARTQTPSADAAALVEARAHLERYRRERRLPTISRRRATRLNAIRASALLRRAIRSISSWASASRCT